MPVRWLSPHPHGRNFFLCGISAVQKDQSFILRVRKYELRVAEPFILCRTLVPIMTAAYYHCGTKYRNSKGSLHLISPTVFFPCTIFYSPRPSRHTLKVLKIIFQSTQKLRSLTYFTSRSIHSSKERSLRCGAICQ